MQKAKYYQSILNCMNEQVYVRDLDMNIIYINSAAEKLVGWTLEESLGKKCYEVFGDGSLECRDICPVEKAISENCNVLHHEGELKTRNGDIREMRVSISSLKEDGKTTGAIVVMQDITDFKALEKSHIKTLMKMEKMQDSLKKSEFNLKQAQAVAGVGSWHLDISKDVLTWSDETYRMFGVDKGTPLNNAIFLGIVHPEDRKMVEFAWQAALNGRPYDIEHRIIVRGDTLWVHEKAQFVFNDEGAPSEAIGTVHDVNDRKQSLERTEQLNRLNEVLLRPDSLNKKLKIITDEIVKIFKADFARIWIIKTGDLCDATCLHANVSDGPHSCRHTDRCLHLVASSGRYNHIDGDHQRVPYGAYQISHIASAQCDKFVTNDVANDNHFRDRKWARKLGLNSFAGYKIFSDKNEPIGILALFKKKTISPVVNAQLESLSNITSQVIQASLKEDALLNEKSKLSHALSEIKKLSGMLPICSACKKIRDDRGYWNQIESFIQDRSEAEFSHSICPECAKKLYPDFDI